VNDRKTSSNDLLELNHLQRYLVEEYAEDYQEGALTRRQALKSIAAVLGSMAAASSFLAACAPAPSASAPAAAGATATTGATATATSGAAISPLLTPTADQAAEATVMATNTVVATTDTSPVATPSASSLSVPENDPAIQAQTVTFPGDGLDVIAYLARPAGGDEPRPAILVCHENRGLTDHIKDVTRRVAKAGYVGLAVDLLSSQGGTDKVTDPNQIPTTLGSASPDALAGYFLSGIDYLEQQPFVDKGRYGMVGFCFGGGITWLVATKAQKLKAAVPFYGPNPPLDAVPDIQAAVLGIYGGEDQRIDAGIPAIEAAMKQNGKTFEKIIYEGAAHAFHNDTGRNYKPDAAADAWAKTLAWFEKYV
jgi:carboxymethylenebutenolidase